jgi:HAD superfamily hydrolase (TIGR01509 family)
MPILLLDVMETLVNEPFYEHLPQFFGLTMEELLKIVHPKAWVEFELGNLDETAYAKTFFRDGREVDLQALKGAMYAAYEYLDGVEELLAELKAENIPMYALSNYPSFYLLIEDKLKLSRFVDWRFVSCRTGVRKPDAEAYLGAARALGVETSKCIFVDDRLKNVEAAKALGMGGILRPKSIAEFREKLFSELRNRQ